MRPPSIEQLQARIARKSRARQSIARDVVRLQDARHAQLRAEIERQQLDQARERREPGSHQREFALDE